MLISTHTSRVGCDKLKRIVLKHYIHFYSHIPCGMWLLRDTTSNHKLKISTHTSRVGCDSIGIHIVIESWYFYSHIPCGMWPYVIFSPPLSYYISTHTSRVGCDLKAESSYLSEQDFYSHIPCGMWHYSNARRGQHYVFLLTHPVWDVTSSSAMLPICSRISTHTSRVGCDSNVSVSRKMNGNFYSHIPCGMWRKSAESTTAQSWFLLTHPVWDVTRQNNRYDGWAGISTHTSRVGCDDWYYQTGTDTGEFLLTHPVWDVTNEAGEFLSLDGNFYSHIPCGMWQINAYAWYNKYIISTHTSRVGCDSLLPIISVRFSISTHTSRVGCDLFSFFAYCTPGISTHTSRVGCDTNRGLRSGDDSISTHTSRVGCDRKSGCRRRTF